jgi:hypothetical protein
LPVHWLGSLVAGPVAQTPLRQIGAVTLPVQVAVVQVELTYRGSEQSFACSQH